jgi:exonuclease VII large subunit
MQQLLMNADGTWAQYSSELNALSPLAILSRGYSITSKLHSTEEESSSTTILRDSSSLSVGDELEIQLHSGKVRACVTEVSSVDPREVPTSD